MWNCVELDTCEKHFSLINQTNQTKYIWNRIKWEMYGKYKRLTAWRVISFNQEKKPKTRPSPVFFFSPPFTLLLLHFFVCSWHFWSEHRTNHSVMMLSYFLFIMMHCAEKYGKIRNENIEIVYLPFERRRIRWPA